MKKILLYISLLVFTFGLPMLTSWLLDLDWIAEQMPRKILIWLLMLIEFAWGILMITQAVKNKLNQR